MEKLFGFENDTHDNDHPDQDIVINQITRMKAGKPADERWLPKSMWPPYFARSGRLKKIANLHLFSAGGYWAVSKEFGDFLQQFQLGQINFYPLELFRRDKETSVDESYEYLNLLAYKSALELSQSQNFDTQDYVAGGQFHR